MPLANYWQERGNPEKALLLHTTLRAQTAEKIEDKE